MKKFLKWLALGVGGLVLLVVAAIIIIPFVIDVDKYRPEIVRVANEKIHGRLELGKLSLSLWGQIRIDIAGLELKDAKGQQILGVKEAFFHVPFSSVLSGEPILTLKLRSPDVSLQKSANGKLNAVGLLPTGSPALESQAQGGDTAQAQAPEKGEPARITLPAIAAKTRLGLELLEAKVTYTDQTTGLKTRISDLNIILRDISLSKTTQLEIWANLDTKFGEKLTARGLVRLTGAANPQFADGRFVKIAAALKLEAGDLEIGVPGLFAKPKGVPIQADLAVGASEKEIRFERLNLKFHNAEIKASGVVSGFLTEGGVPSARFELTSNPIELKPWQELVPLMKLFDPSGSLQVKAQASGPVNSLSYEAAIELANLAAKLPKLKSAPILNGKIHVVTDQVDSMLLSVKAPGNALELRGKVVSFKAPQVDLTVTSTGMDLDQWVELPPLGTKSAETAPAAVSTGAASQGSTPAAQTQASDPAKSDFDALLAPLRDSSIARATGLKANVNLAFVKVYDIRLSEITGVLGMKNLAATLDRLAMKLWKGTITADASADLAKAVPTYRFSSKVSQLDLGEAVSSQLQLFKNTVVGKADFQITGEGTSFNPEPAMKNLKARGSMSMRDASFATVDVSKMLGDALNRALDRVGDRVPQLKGRTIQPLSNRESRYDLITSDFSIQDGKFSAPNFTAKAAAGKGIDLSGSTSVGMIDKSLKASWSVVDTYDRARASEVAVDLGGVHVEKVLLEQGKALRIPINVGCTLSAPCYSYTEVPEYLAKVAASNVARAAKGAAQNRVTEELKKRAAPLLDQAQPAVQKGLDELRKKLFR